MRVLLDGETYGLAISRATGLKAGTLYPLLLRLEAAGWVEGRREEIDQRAEGRRARHYYRLTRAGRRVAREALASALDGLG